MLPSEFVESYYNLLTQIVRKFEDYYDNWIIKFKQLFWLPQWTEH